MKDVHLSRKLELEGAQRVSDGAGGFEETWITLGTLWADMRARTGRTRDGGELSLSSTGYRVIVRAAPVDAPSRPVAGMRFREGHRAFVINAVSDRDPKGRYLTCFATEEVVQ
ncbi:head-tail adaptor protein [Shimia thalassica]|uniref:head-tail adaptor protein n=1 Tax=Shimia thalassica TaxID=1715693 RepID=UPI0024954DAF|nr:head-tail adaptor protein [Shimia thalassica]